MCLNPSTHSHRSSFPVLLAMHQIDERCPRVSSGLGRIHQEDRQKLKGRGDDIYEPVKWHLIAGYMCYWYPVIAGCVSGSPAALPVSNQIPNVVLVSDGDGIMSINYPKNAFEERLHCINEMHWMWVTRKKTRPVAIVICKNKNTTTTCYTPSALQLIHNAVLIWHNDDIAGPSTTASLLTEKLCMLSSLVCKFREWWPSVGLDGCIEV